MGRVRPFLCLLSRPPTHMFLLTWGWGGGAFHSRWQMSYHCHVKKKNALSHRDQKDKGHEAVDINVGRLSSVPVLALMQQPKKIGNIVSVKEVV